MSEITQADVLKVMRERHVAMLTCLDPDGSLHSHPMTPQQVTDDADVYLFIGLDGHQAAQLRAHAAANLAFAETGSWLSVAGTVEFLADRAKIDELWNDEAALWYEGGKSDPNLGLIRFHSQSAQYWGTPGGKPAALASFLKSKITGTKPDATSETFDL